MKLKIILKYNLHTQSWTPLHVPSIRHVLICSLFPLLDGTACPLLHVACTVPWYLVLDGVSQLPFLNGIKGVGQFHPVEGNKELLSHYDDVIMGTMTSQITSLTIVYSTVYSDADQRKHKWLVTRKMFPFDDVTMINQKHSTQNRTRFLSLVRSKPTLCSVNHRVGYFTYLACDWPSIVWAYSEQETEKGPRSIVVPKRCCYSDVSWALKHLQSPATRIFVE